MIEDIDWEEEINMILIKDSIRDLDLDELINGDGTMLMDEMIEGFGSFETKEFYFYGVYGNSFMIDDMVLSAVEKPYDLEKTSYLSHIYHNLNADISKFSDKPLAKIRIIPIHKEEAYIEGWIFVDDDGHIWFTLGTDYRDNYEPSFAFKYTPNRNVKLIDVEEGYIPYREKHPEEVVKYPNWFGGHEPNEERDRKTIQFDYDPWD